MRSVFEHGRLNWHTVGLRVGGLTSVSDGRPPPASHTQTGEPANLVGSNGMDEMDGLGAAHAIDYYRVNTLNPYKRAWYLASSPGAHERTVSPETKTERKRESFGQEFRRHVKQDVQRAGIHAGLGAAGLAFRYAARSQVTGRLGVATRIGGRIGLRVVPVVGAALIAYDLYQFGKWLAE